MSDEHVYSPERTPVSPSSGRAGPPVSLILFLVVLALAVVFVFQNNDTTDIDFLFFTWTSRVWTAIAVALVIGIVLDRLFIGWWRRRRQRRA